MDHPELVMDEVQPGQSRTDYPQRHGRSVLGRKVGETMFETSPCAELGDEIWRSRVHPVSEVLGHVPRKTVDRDPGVFQGLAFHFEATGHIGVLDPIRGQNLDSNIAPALVGGGVGRGEAARTSDSGDGALSDFSRLHQPHLPRAPSSQP